MIRNNTVTPSQHEETAVVLGMIGFALRTAAQAIEQHPDDPPSAAASVAGAWQPVSAEFARLLAATG